MDLYTARLLLPIQHRLDWKTPRLTYLPHDLYGFGIVSRAFRSIFR